MSSHMIRGRQLSRDTEHRKALRRNLVQSLFEHGKIRTTLPKAKELIFTGRQVKVDEALALGIVDRKTSAETLVADAQAWARELSSASSTALALTKTILNQSFELSSHDVFAQGSQAQGICYTSSEHRASVEAFLAKTASKE